MPYESNLRTDVIMAGLGGMGVLMAGQILSSAALKKYRHVSWLPSYGVQKRGGLCECTVIFSDEEIASPIIDQARTVVIFDGSQLEAFEPRILDGGTVLVEKTGLQEDHTEKNYKLIKVPGLEAAVSLGESKTNNLILLGTYVGLTDTIPPGLIRQELENRFGRKKQVFELNLKAFEQGLELGDSLKR